MGSMQVLQHTQMGRQQCLLSLYMTVQSSVDAAAGVHNIVVLRFMMARCLQYQAVIAWHAVHSVLPFFVSLTWTCAMSPC